MEIKLPLITDSDNTYSTESITLRKNPNTYRLETLAVTAWRESITIEIGDRRVSVDKGDLMKAISVL